MKVHHILADGREVDSVAGHVININDFPALQKAFIDEYRRCTEGEAAEQEAEAG